MELPPGFRFHPSDEELITHYLTPKLLDNDFVARAIGEVDLNKCEPWDLPRRAKMGEKEWYFFCVRDRKYPTGLRTNRATEAGYWKATGKDKEIFRGNVLVGMKKTLVFHKGRAPKGENSNWVMHEFRLEGENSLQNIPSNAKQKEWVISRVFQKNAAGEKIRFTRLIRPESSSIQYNPSGNLPPLMESSPYVSCFSNADQSSYDGFISSPFPSFPSHPDNNNFPRISADDSYFPGNYLMSDQNILRDIIDNNETEENQCVKTEEFNYSASQDTGLSSDVHAEISSVVSNYEFDRRPFDAIDGLSMSGGPVDLENLWNYW